MKLFALLALFVASCGSSSSPPPDGGLAGADGAADTSPDIDAAADTSPETGGSTTYPDCPQHRVEPLECPSSTAPDGVSRKEGLICASCSGVDSTGTPTTKPVGCKTVASDLCVAACGECS
jgi:hypothetical protein